MALLQKALTERERNVVTLLVQGYTPKEIAVLMRISPHTVSAHKHTAANKLGIHGTVELVKWAIREGVVDL
jgi:two-component system response regulator NreC